MLSLHQVKKICSVLGAYKKIQKNVFIIFLLAIVLLFERKVFENLNFLFYF